MLRIVRKIEGRLRKTAEANQINEKAFVVSYQKHKVRAFDKGWQLLYRRELLKEGIPVLGEEVFEIQEIYSRHNEEAGDCMF